MKPARAFLAGVFFAGILLAGIFAGLFFGVFFAHERLAFAQTPSSDVSAEIGRIKQGITERNDRLKAIEAEIAKYQSELTKVGGEKATLQNAIRTLELERKKVQGDISYTQNKIGATDLEIQKLDIEIEETGAHIGRNRLAIEEMIRRINETDQLSLVEALLSTDDLSEVWTTLDGLAEVRGVMGDRMRDLSELKYVLEDKLGEHHGRRDDLVALKDRYAGQQKVLEVNKSEKNQLLAETKNQEASYQTLLAEKKAAKEQFERELNELEAKLQFILNPDTIPQGGTTVLQWPLDSVVITQYFGNTSFARAGAYNGAGHNGIDLGTPVGTPVKAALGGTVSGTGNTDVGGCSSYGKWVLIKHGNGLSTLYAHLSVISVKSGDQVATGGMIGLSGRTGYATGPHLHLSVFASDGVSIKNLGDWYRQSGREPTTACAMAGVAIPVAAFSAYLDPMLYLPPR
jgi:murein DD-endopeptidase MepM/ murein hydrolase activator NlpD